MLNYKKKIIFKNFSMAKSYKKIDWNEVKKIIPEKPDKWKIDPLGKFLKLCDLSGVIQAFSLFFFIYFGNHS